jgi:hypothetical protein
MEQDELGIDGMKEFKSKIKFLDIVINHYASEQNPHRKGLFLGFVKRQGVNCLEMTDIRGESKWYQVFDKHSKLEIAENFVNNQLNLPN